jgi:hypothetical protein
VKAQVLEQHNVTVVRLVDDLLDLRADAVGGKGHALAQQLLELGHDGLQRVLGVDLAVGAAQVRHEDNSLGAIVDGVLDGRDGADNALGVGDLLVGVERDVEVDLVSISASGRSMLLVSQESLELKTYADQDTLALEVDVLDGELVGQRHLGDSTEQLATEGSS